MDGEGGALRVLKCSGSHLVARYSGRYLRNNLRIVASPSLLCPPFHSHLRQLPNSISTRHTPPRLEYSPQRAWYLVCMHLRALLGCSCTRAFRPDSCRFPCCSRCTVLHPR